MDLFADIPLPSVALLGTSYSANPNWNFEGSLKLALNKDLINFATEGEGPFIPMIDFLERHLKTLPSLELVIWEIPERYLAQQHSVQLAIPQQLASTNN